MARLLDPTDFGLVGMVTAVIGALGLFRDCGLSIATVQRATISHVQVSALFWINLGVGGVLALVTLGMAPAVAAWYHEPRLVGITAVLAIGFLVDAAGMQHGAVVNRHLRFATTAAIDCVALGAGVAAGIGLALLGYGYWALVAAVVVPSCVRTGALWLAAGWMPGWPRRGAGIGALIRFGGLLTLNSLVTYVAYNLELALLGRMWGPAALGLYGRAYTLITLPTENLHGALGDVAIASLSRLQDDPQRFQKSFLQGYAAVVSITLPLTLFCAVFAQELLLVLLGAKWSAAIPIFRGLAPAALILAVINPLGWVQLSLGMLKRSLAIDLVLASLVITGYLVGLPYGPQGVALAYSTVMVVWAVPHLAWCVRGTGIALRDVLRAASRPLLSGLVAAALALGLSYLDHRLSPFLRLVLGGTVYCSAYLGVLLYGMEQTGFYFGLIRGLIASGALGQKSAQEPDRAWSPQ
jgi:PST family polysaccharide transporter